MTSRTSTISTTSSAAALLSLLVMTACGGSPTDAGAPEASDEQAEDAYAEAFTELEGLEGSARHDRLVELAEEEGQLSVYTSSTDVPALAEDFGSLYDIEVDVYRAQANQVLQRVLQENEAGYPGADVYETSGEELSIANREGLLREYRGPAADGLVEEADQEGWVGSRLNLFTVAWNDGVVDEPPTSFEDLADERFAGISMIESRAFEWFMTMSDYFAEEREMSQQEFDELVGDIVANSVVVEGHTTHAQFLASGEYGLSVTVYNHLVDELTDAGAPVHREPVVEPVVLRPNGLGLLQGAHNPAAALLFSEWILTDAQEGLPAHFQIPTREDLQDGSLDEIETIDVDMERLVAERDDWENRFEELLRGAQGRDG